MIPHSLSRKLEELSYLVTEQQFEVESVDPQTTILRGYLQFIGGSLLHFMEYTGPDKHDYRFHYMDENKSLVRRWDNAPHHQELGNFPFYVHTPEGVKPSSEITLFEVLDKVEELILESLQS